MKYSFIIFTLMFFIFSCSNIEEDFEFVNYEEEIYNSEFLVDASIATENARNFLAAMGKENEVLDSRCYDTAISCTRINPSQSRASTNNGFYLINFENGGFALTSADKRDNAFVYIASEKINFYDTDLQQSDLMQYFISLIESYQEYEFGEMGMNHQSRTHDPADYGTFVTETTVLANYGPLLSTAWTQWSPFNLMIKDLSSNKYLGCVPVAVGQIMSYHGKPTTFHGQNMNWSLIRSVTDNHYTTSNGVIECSTFLKNLGEDLGIDYTTSYRGTTINHAYDVLRRNGYALDPIANYNVNNVLSSIINLRPVLMRGSDGTDSHQWVADGYLAIKEETRVYDEDGNYIPNTIVFVYNTSNTHYYLHINPGYGSISLYNAMFQSHFELLDDDPNPITYVYNNIFNMDGHSFNQSVKTICNIR